MDQFFDREADAEDRDANENRASEFGELRERVDFVHGGAEVPGEKQWEDQFARRERAEGHERVRPSALRPSSVEPSHERDAPTLIRADDEHQQQTERRGKAAERTQHDEQPVESGHVHHEPRREPENQRALRRLPAKRQKQWNERDERQRPRVTPGKREPVENAGEYRGRRGGRRAERKERPRLRQRHPVRGVRTPPSPTGLSR